MKLSPILMVAAASAATLAAGQALPPTVHARSMAAPAYHLRLDRQTVEKTAGGLAICGRVTNTGRLPLVYAQVTPVLRNRSGAAVFWGSGYLTASPLRPGESAEFRAWEASPPPFSTVTVSFHEAGRPVSLDDGRTAKPF